MLNLCLNFNESQPIYVYKRYAYRKRVYHKEKHFLTVCINFKKFPLKLVTLSELRISESSLFYSTNSVKGKKEFLK